MVGWSMTSILSSDATRFTSSMRPARARLRPWPSARRLRPELKRPSPSFALQQPYVGLGALGPRTLPFGPPLAIFPQGSGGFRIVNPASDRGDESRVISQRKKPAGFLISNHGLVSGDPTG